MWTMVQMDPSFLVDGASVRLAGDKGVGVFIDRPLAAGVVVAAFGGDVVTSDGFDLLDNHRRRHSLQIADQLYLVGPAHDEPARMLNHSCDPNCGLWGSQLVVTRVAVEAGDELTFDYAMCDSDPYDEFECRCATTLCRRRVSGDDWRLPELQERYDGFFSPYLAARFPHHP
jgi:hypothetical protein